MLSTYYTNYLKNNILNKVAVISINKSNTRYASNKITKDRENNKNNNTSNSNTSNNEIDIKPISKSTKSIEDLYQKKTQREHILLRPETYIGSSQYINTYNWYYKDPLVYKNKNLIYENIDFIPALYKIFDEILVNAADNIHRSEGKMTEIKVNITYDKELIISIYNDGKTIPVVMHNTENIYVPELIFGHLLTSSNYDDTEQRYVGGRHGYGAKLTNIFSKSFSVDLYDHERGLQYHQQFKNNMSIIGKPEITKVSGKRSWTKITFSPDLSQFQLPTVNASFIKSLIATFRSRVYDISATLHDKNIGVYFNDNKFEYTSFEKFVESHYPIEIVKGIPINPFIYTEVLNWKIAVSLARPDLPHHCSYVNSIRTSRGGTHITHILDLISERILSIINKKHKDLPITIALIKRSLLVVAICQVANPAFDSQTKENLTFPKTFKLDFSASFYKDLFNNSGIIEYIVANLLQKQSNDFSKKVKSSSMLKIAKLNDANWAGGKNSKECTLIVTEGDSAKALAMAGLTIVGFQKFGVFSLRGKFLNVREAPQSQIMENEEVKNLMTILGLSPSKKYSSPAEIATLRYGKLMLMTDQDTDGSHIKGLLINFIHFYWPELLKNSDFLIEFITPILKATCGSESLSFYSVAEYDSWRNNVDIKKWNIKYYKGLGTSTAAEGKDYFSSIDRHCVKFVWDPVAFASGLEPSAKVSTACNSAIELAFSKAQADARKKWIMAYKPSNENPIQQLKAKKSAFLALTIPDFINRELILFSVADCFRSIPSLFDGFKVGQRKIIYSCFKRRLDKEIKVAQLSGYVAEHSSYHHGEASLHSTIINMAQDFVGSNNLSLLVPSGQFGTRHLGGKDSASARYLFTTLQPITRFLFRPEDDDILNYREDDGVIVEPTVYMPIIPMVLVNGADGVGTGYSTSVPRYNPLQIISNLRLALDEKIMKSMTPWSAGFTGTIKEESSKSVKSFVTYGIIKRFDNTTIEITELPLGVWTSEYKERMNNWIQAREINKKDDKLSSKPIDFNKNIPLLSYTEHHTNTAISFRLKFDSKDLKLLLLEEALWPSLFKLESNIKISNMHLFDFDGKIAKYDNEIEIMKTFIPTRLEFYEKRKKFQLQELMKKQDLLGEKLKFIEKVISKEINITNISKSEIVKTLVANGFKYSKENSEVDFAKLNDFDYLLNMPLHSLTREKFNQIKEENEKSLQTIKRLDKKTSKEIWLEELSELEIEIVKLYTSLPAPSTIVEKKLKLYNKTTKILKASKTKVKSL